MNLKRLSQLLKNDYIQTIILAIILFVGVFAFWFGLRLAFQSDFPLLAVASGSMEPNLYRGDLIIVQGISDFSELHVGLYTFPNGTLNPNPGEAVVYYHPESDRPPPIYLPIAGTEAHLIVHRAVEKNQLENGTWEFETKGDASWGSSYDPWGPIRQDLIVGKVVGKVPWLGHIPLFMHENPISATLIIGFLFVVLIIVDFVFPEKEDEKTKGQEEKLLNNTISKKRVPKDR
ncbi:MAG: S26 family signal peptidase [Candidatus Bathyarchaeia archaeon]